jgi:hypothetical protein
MILDQLPLTAVLPALTNPEKLAALLLLFFAVINPLPCILTTHELIVPSMRPGSIG